MIAVIEKEGKEERTATYMYDNVGNRIAVRRWKNKQSLGTQEWKNNADNQLTEITSEKGATFKYDKNGHVSEKHNTLTGVVTFYKYDAEGKVIQEASTSGELTVYQYDALGNRVAKGIDTENGRKIKTDLKKWMKATDRESQLKLKDEDVTLQDQLEKEAKSPSITKLTSTKNKTWQIDHNKNRRATQDEKLKKELVPNETLEVIEYSNDYTQQFVSPLEATHTVYDKKVKSTFKETTTYDQKGMAIASDLDEYRQDGQLSNATQISQETNQLYSNNLYDAFGQSERPINDQAGYRSQYHDTSENIHLRAREYRADLGRFTQEDIVTGNLKQTVTQNKYTYANNNPFMYRDDAGRWGWLSKAFNAVKSVAKKVVNTVVSVAKKVVNTVVNVAKTVVNTVKNVFSGAVQTVQNVATQAYQTASNGIRYVQNQAQQFASNPYNYVMTKAQEAQHAIEQAKQVAIAVAQETRAIAEARIKKMCEGASAIWNGAAQSVGDFVKKNESAIRLGLSVTAGILTLFPATTAVGVGMTLALGAYSVGNAIKGQNLVTGQELSTGERLTEGLTGILSVIPGVSQAAKGSGLSSTVSSMLSDSKAGFEAVHGGGNLALATGEVISSAGSVTSSVSEVISNATNGALTNVIGSAANAYANSGGDNSSETVTSNKGNDYDYTPSNKHTQGKPGENPVKGEPNSSMDIYDRQGNHVQRRWYDENGNACRDIDLTNHGNPKAHSEVPHEHEITWNDGKMSRP